ncbi:MAG: putative toxin-antitoxin system toxin component, PIN family [Oscillospiraceae bacterium]|nr:putative toxin-antitoxin system toxin component, PIN family [Oscillospiraceae bacterium]
MPYYAVIDTNILVSALLTKHEDAATLKIMRAVFSGVIIPLYHTDIITEYIEVLSRPKFHFKSETIQTMINAIVTNGIAVTPDPTGEILPDMDDLIFYEVTMSKRNENAYLVTGNLKHYPNRSYIVDASEMVHIMQENSD